MICYIIDQVMSWDWDQKNVQITFFKKLIYILNRG